MVTVMTSSYIASQNRFDGTVSETRRKLDLQYDVAIVLGGDLLNDGGLTNESIMRVNATVDLYLRGGVRKVIFTGGVVSGMEKSTGAIMKEYAEGKGVKEEDSIVEGLARNTLGNAYHVNRILQLRNWSKIVIVTSDFHVPRAMLIFKKVLGSGFQIDAVPAGTPREEYNRREWGERFLFFIHELVLLGIADGNSEAVRSRLEFLGLPLLISAAK